mmetsp:Transcript_22944/g.50189  ORF Transcript_22944/g.50189 Transcript_22944/m.50189 type:complete len:385 (-) Transcript_22944:356-1510(-)
MCKSHGQHAKRPLTDSQDNVGVKKIKIRSKEICNARILLLGCGIDWKQVNMNKVEPLASKRTKTGYVGTFACGRRWQGQYLHRTLGTCDTPYEAGCGVARAVLNLARFQMPEDADKVVFDGCLSSLAAPGAGANSKVECTPVIATKTEAASPFDTPRITDCASETSALPSPQLAAPIPVRLATPGFPSASAFKPASARCVRPRVEHSYHAANRAMAPGCMQVVQPLCAHQGQSSLPADPGWAAACCPVSYAAAGAAPAFPASYTVPWHQMHSMPPPQVGTDQLQCMPPPQANPALHGPYEPGSNQYYVHASSSANYNEHAFASLPIHQVGPGCAEIGWNSQPQHTQGWHPAGANFNGVAPICFDFCPPTTGTVQGMPTFASHRP